jgi:hypothetical protein
MTRKDAAVLRAINRTKLDDIAARARAYNDWDVAQTRRAIEWYRHYLWASYKHRGQPVFAIVQEADELWHAHLAYTKRYRADCQRIFGRFLDHNPVHGRLTKRMRDAFDDAVDWFKKEYPDEFPQPKVAFKGKAPLVFIHPCY